MDVQEMLKRQINQQGSDDIEYRLYGSGGGYIPKPFPRFVKGPTDYNEVVTNTVQEKIKKRNEIGIEDTYIYCDSVDKDPISIPSQGLYIFDVYGLNNGFPMKNIIEMEIEKFYIPDIEVNSAYQPSYFYFGKVLLEIENIAGQQYVNGGKRSKNFHFELKTSPATNGLLLSPLNSKYIFTMPLYDLTQLRFRFKTGFQNVAFSQDVFDCAAVNPPAGGPGGDRRITTAEPHGLAPATTEEILFLDFNSTNFALNSTLTNPIGHIVDVVDSNTLQLTATPGANDLGSAVDLDGNPASGQIVIMRRRIAFTIRFRSVRSDLTNFIAP